MFVRQLNQSITTLRGVGKALGESYRALGVTLWQDLLLLAPRDYEDRRQVITLNQIEHNGLVNTVVEVVHHSYFGFGKKRTLKVTVRELEGHSPTEAELLCFGRNFLANILQVGGHFYLHGHFQYNYRQLQSSQFEMLPLAPDGSIPPPFGQILPLYPLSGILTQRVIRRDIAAILSQSESFAEELPDYIIERCQLLSTDQAIRELHRPTNQQLLVQAKRTLAFTELFYLQLIGRRKRSANAERQVAPLLADLHQLSALEEQFIKSLPFNLTADQESVLAEIRADLATSTPMNRLLQGDVGAGKTLVAWISALRVIATKGQVAFMAPTELLARQHAEKAAELLEPLGVSVAFLTGSVNTSARKLLLGALKAGQIDIIIGTHALFSQDVIFNNLRYIIIDEQQRFGVVQRISLLEKAETPDVLLMTATPIPRTLALTVFGDLDVSTIRMLPQGRLPVVTYLVSAKNRLRMYESIGVEFRRGHQAYFVYPRIDAEGKSTLRDVESMYAELTTNIYPGVKAKLIHSRLPEEEKVEILRSFAAQEISYLVSTSVVEVGIDIPNATCMVVEHAERFGLSALHQLRGRVGRSTLQSYCFLVYEENLSEEGRERLMVMKQSNDGFEIAEKDLLIRGPGEIAGLKQSGFLKLRFASLTSNIELIGEAKGVVDELLAQDENLSESRHQVIRALLLHAPPFEEQFMEG